MDATPINKEKLLGFMKILVTGGTGFLGRALTKKLLKANYAVNVVSRRAPDNKNTIDGVTYHQCDLSRKRYHARL